MSEILLQIDGKEVAATDGMTVLEAAQKRRDIHTHALSPRKTGTLRGLPDLHRGSGSSRLDKARCFLRLSGRRTTWWSEPGPRGSTESAK